VRVLRRGRASLGDAVNSIVTELLRAAEQALNAALECQDLQTRKKLVAAANDCIDLIAVHRPPSIHLSNGISGRS